jgi:hypothetical protein
MALQCIRVIANANNKQLRTVNVVTTQTGKTFEQHTQKNTSDRSWETVQAAAAPTAGLRTIHIAGYSGPL